MSRSSFATSQQRSQAEADRWLRPFWTDPDDPRNWEASLSADRPATQPAVAVFENGAVDRDTVALSTARWQPLVVDPDKQLFLRRYEDGVWARLVSGGDRSGGDLRENGGHVMSMQYRTARVKQQFWSGEAQ